MHFNGQSTVELNGDRATGESYCLPPDIPYLRHPA
jgi:hypothetical protein